MRPTLFRLGGIPIPTHDFFVLLGVLTGVLVLVLEARRRRMMSEQLAWIVAGSMLSGAIVGKLSTGWFYLSQSSHPSLAGLWTQGGKSVLGGLAGAYAGALVTKRIIGYREKTGDVFAPAVAAAMAVGRWGCFLTEQIGTPTSLPWGIRVEPAVGARIPNCPQCVSGTAMHPSFLYEIAFHALAFGILVWLRPRMHVKGELFKIYLLGYAAFRFLVEFVRGNAQRWMGLSGSQIFLLVTMPLLAAYFARQAARGAYRPAPEPA